VRSDARLVEQLWCELAGERLDLACELAFLGGQLQHAARDRAQREQAAAQLGVLATVRSCCCETPQQPCPRQRPQLVAQRLRGGDQQVVQLAEPGPLGVDRSFARSDKCLQRLAFPTRTRCRGPLLGEHAAGRADSVQGVGLATRAALPAQAADLEHPLTAPGQKASQAGTKRPCPFDSERATSCAEFLDELQRPCVTVAVRVDDRLEDDSAADDLDDRDRMRVAVWINTDDVVQLICKHPSIDLQPKSWGTRTGVGLGMEPRAAEL
jgi:hypothetical protein